MVPTLASLSSIAAAGFDAAARRLGVTAHNLANLGTEGFRPLRARQVALESGGSAVQVEQVADPEPVDAAREFVEQIRASFQARASLRVLGVAAELSGRLVDITV